MSRRPASQPMRSASRDPATLTGAAAPLPPNIAEPLLPGAADFPVFLAPMAGITDLPFRRAVARHGGAGLMVSEMVASTEMATSRPSSRAMARARAEVEGAVPVSVQIAGREAGPMAETARVVAAMGARIIDINMGCPARKVTGGLSGAALMRDLDHAMRLVDAVMEAVPELPITLKMRLGWDADCLNAPQLAARAARAGVRMLTVHGRTRAQFYTGSADPGAIAPAFRAATEAARGAGLPAPLTVANGDVRDTASAARALRHSGASAVMIGRAAQGAPWRLAAIAAGLAGLVAPAAPRGAALADTVAQHYEDMLAFYGAELGPRVARKHLGWWAEAAGIPEARAALVRAATPAAARAEIAARFADAPGEDSARAVVAA